MLTRRLTVTVAALTLAGLLAGCGGGGDGDGSDVASIDENAASESDDAPDEGGGDSPRDSQEFQDAMLEYAECMREHGIDMPDPEFNGDGGVTQRMPEGSAGQIGPDGEPSEEFQAAEEACRSIIEDVMPEMDLSPEEEAERQDQMLAMAECMRAKGHDMPDPEFGDDGSVRIGRRVGPGGADPADDEQFQEDMEACSEEAGLPRPGGPDTVGGSSDGEGSDE
jgi:hypothetical protein